MWAASVIDVEATGFVAIGMGGALLLATMAATVAAATLAHRLVERPGTEIARWLASTRKTPAGLVVVPQAQCELPGIQFSWPASRQNHQLFARERPQRIGEFR